MFALLFLCLSAWCVDSDDAGGARDCVDPLLEERVASCRASIDAPVWDLQRLPAMIETAQRNSWGEISYDLFLLCLSADVVNKDTPCDMLVSCLRDFRSICVKVDCIVQHFCLCCNSGLRQEASDDPKKLLVKSAVWTCLKRKFQASVALWKEESVREALRTLDGDRDGVLLKALRKEQGHTLSPEEEFAWLIAEIVESSQGKSLALSKLGSMRIVCGRQTVSAAGAKVLVESYDERKRKEAVDGVLAAFEANEPHLLACFNVVVKSHAQFYQARKYDSPDAQRHLLNGLDAVWADELRRSVLRSYHQTSHALMEVRSVVLGKSKLDIHDALAPIMPQRATTWREGYEFVCGAYEALDASFGYYARSLLSQGRLRLTPDDFELGASCKCTPDGPYIQSGYYGNLESFLKLAHECGHAVHMLFSGWLPGGFGSAVEGDLFFAEIAALFSEALCVDYAARQLTKLEGDAFFVGGVASLVASVQGSISQDRFEKNMHVLGVSGDLLPKDVHDAWLETCRDLFGDTVDVPDAVGVLWPAYTQLFSKPFYAYSHAMACLFSRVLFEKKDQPGFVDKYKTFLHKSHVMSFCDVRRLFDVTDDPVEFFKGALALVVKDVDAVRRIVLMDC